MFNGFATLADYERECNRCGMKVERRGYHKDGAPYVLVITRAASGVPSWHLLAADESTELLSGIVPDAEWMRRTGGEDRNFSGVLSTHGYIPDDAPVDDPPPVPELYAAAPDAAGFQQLAFFA